MFFYVLFCFDSVNFEFFISVVFEMFHATTFASSFPLLICSTIHSMPS